MVFNIIQNSFKVINLNIKDVVNVKIKSELINQMQKIITISQLFIDFRKNKEVIKQEISKNFPVFKWIFKKGKGMNDSFHPVMDSKVK